MPSPSARSRAPGRAEPARAAPPWCGTGPAHRAYSRRAVSTGAREGISRLQAGEDVNPAKRDAQGNITEPGSDPYGGTGEWSFRRNRQAVGAYWADGVRRMAEGGFEGAVTLGMRGNGDVSLPDGDGIDLMRSILGGCGTPSRSTTPNRGR